LREIWDNGNLERESLMATERFYNTTKTRSIIKIDDTGHLQDG
jgi:hypothetical protein